MKQNSWSTFRISLVLYPLGAGAMAVNLFFASLMLSWFALPVLTPT
ncbi:MAG: NnrT protein, partial [Sulfitobacter sp.]